MSLEQAITDHAGALRELAAAIRSTISGAAEIGQATDKVIADAKKSTAAAASSASGAKPETTVKKDAAPAKVEEAKQDTAKPEAIEYEAVKAKVLALAQTKGRDTLVALLQRYGVTKAPDLKPMQYADFVKDIDSIEAGTYEREAAAAELA